MVMILFEGNLCPHNREAGFSPQERSSAGGTSAHASAWHGAGSFYIIF